MDEIGKPERETQRRLIKLINWKQPSKNHFAIAEEVALKGGHERRPDLVLYINGLAIGTIELKNMSPSAKGACSYSLNSAPLSHTEWSY